jgi:type II secretory ATPase GspE/PulE/Tfp pilus assembly ATPase PilB-like protein
MMIDERFHEPIVKRAGAPEYLRLARENGMRTMFEDGLIKAVQGHHNHRRIVAGDANVTEQR